MIVKKIGIVSLSSGIIGEDFIKHELHIGMNRLLKMNPIMMNINQFY